MNILLINTYENYGGAAIACKRLAEALISKGENVHLLVNEKVDNKKYVIQTKNNKLSKKINFLYERFEIFLNNKFNKKNLFTVSIASSGKDITTLDVFKNADIINIHWMNQGFLSLRNIKQIIDSGKPIVWTLHDMWPITAICHHSKGCLKFETHCKECPLLNSKKEKDLAYRVFNKKLFLNNSNIILVPVSSWLSKLADKSALVKNLKKTIIGNPIDTNIFVPRNKKSSRKELELPKDKIILTMGAAKLNDPLKGFNYLKKALSFIKNKEDYLLLLFGEIKKDPTFFKGIDVDYKHLGIINDINTLVNIYAASDIIVVPSLYETFGQTISEAMSCGRPAISFNNSGQTDIIDHKINGYLAKYKDSKDMAEGITWIRKNYSKEIEISAREKIKTNFSKEIIANRYLTLYNKF